MDNEKEKKFIGTILLVIIAISVIFLFFVSYYGVKINRNDFCQTQTISYTNNINSNASFILNSTDKYILQKYSIDENYKELVFCYNVETNNTNGAELDIIDQDLNILSTQYILTGSEQYCSMINSKNLKRDSYLGLQCTNCDSDKQVYIKQDTSGTNTEQIKKDNIIYVVSEDPLAFNLVYKKSCVNVIKWLFEWYLFMIFAFCLIILLLLGYNKFSEILFDDV